MIVKMVGMAKKVSLTLLLHVHVVSCCSAGHVTIGYVTCHISRDVTRKVVEEFYEVDFLSR